MHANTEKQFLDIIRHAGELGRLTAEKDWSQHPLGNPQQWPTCLQTTLATILHSQFAHFLFWGKELYCFYNDAYRPSLGETGKHPSIIGMKAEDAWPEIKDFVLEKTSSIFRGEKLELLHDLLVPIERNGRMEDVYWTFCYSPVYNAAFEIAGVLVTCTETTDKVVSHAKLQQSNTLFTNMVMQAPIGICVLEGKDLVLTVANDSYFDIIDRPREVAIGKPILETVSEAKEAVSAVLDQVYQTGEPFYGYAFPIPINKGGVVDIRYFNFVYSPIKDNAGEITSILVIAIDITDNKQVNDQLQQSEQRYRSLADSMPQFVWSADENGDLFYWNKEVYDFTGYTYEELLSNWIGIVHPDDREDNIKQWMKTVEQKSTFLLEHRFKNKDGVYRWQLSRATPQYKEDGQFTGWIGTSTDIDDMKRHEIQKNEFIKMANHELKTPVTNIKGYIQLLLRTQKDTNDPLLLSTLNTLHKQVNKLVILISDLLDVTRIESGQLPLNIVETNISDIIKDAAVDTEVAIDSHNIIFTDNTSGNIQLKIDKDRIGQVILNLLTNAIKYSPQAKEVIVNISENNEEVIISVEDKGIGIEENHIPYLFERFYRAIGDEEKTFPGFGIGLFIVGEIVRRHGGRVWVKSTKNVGSIFYFSLPKP